MAEAKAVINKIIHLVADPVTHELVALTSEGEMFIRSLDQKYFGPGKKYLWKKIEGPLESIPGPAQIEEAVREAVKKVTGG